MTGLLQNLARLGRGEPIAGAARVALPPRFAAPDRTDDAPMLETWPDERQPPESPQAALPDMPRADDPATEAASAAAPDNVAGQRRRALAPRGQGCRCGTADPIERRASRSSGRCSVARRPARSAARARIRVDAGRARDAPAAKRRRNAAARRRSARPYSPASAQRRRETPAGDQGDDRPHRHPLAGAAARRPRRQARAKAVGRRCPTICAARDREARA